MSSCLKIKNDDPEDFLKHWMDMLPSLVIAETKKSKSSTEERLKHLTIRMEERQLCQD